MGRSRKLLHDHGLAWIVCLAFLPGVQARPPAAAPADAARPMPFLGGFLNETRVVYPLEVAGWQAGDEHRYDDQASGVSVGYAPGEAGSGVLTLYFYPAGLLSPQALADEAEAVWDGIGSARRGKDRSVNLGELVPYARVSRPGAPGYIGTLSFANESGTYHSAMALVLDRLYFVKARLSLDAREATLEGTAHELRRIMEALEARLVISSTGACWQVEPGEVLDVDAGSGPDAHLSGCDGPESMNPEVMDGIWI